MALKGHRLIVPQAMRQSLLQDLHTAHQGMTRTKNRARQVVYWPGLTQDIEEMIRYMHLKTLKRITAELKKILWKNRQR